MTEDKIKTLNTMVHHRLQVQAAIQRITQALERRALVHDDSKFHEDEFEGFSRINRVAREHPYGSEEYRASLKAEKPTIDLHYARNPHHPEFYGREIGRMGLLDMIEMVCDWHAAWTVYDGQRPPELQSSWKENVEKQRQRFFVEGPMTAVQWHMVAKIAELLE